MFAEVSVAEWISLSLLIAMLILLLSIRVAVARIESRISRTLQAAETQATSSSQEGSTSAFDQFLAEDPKRLSLSKTEQFAAYREWRKDKGMNWSGS